MTRKIAVIGGSGLSDGMADFQLIDSLKVETPYGTPSSPVLVGELHGRELFFLPRHGHGHTVAPHKINYRANIAALQQVGVEKIVTINAVGGLRDNTPPEMVVIPDQIIDYTWGRESSFLDGISNPLNHVDFTEPYTESLRSVLVSAAHLIGLPCVPRGVYACTQGPRLETAAEIKRLQRDGCDIVGMTAMPEAVLARELGMEYAAMCLVVNWGAGMQEELITMDDIIACINSGMTNIQKLIAQLLKHHTDT